MRDSVGSLIYVKQCDRVIYVVVELFNDRQSKARFGFERHKIVLFDHVNGRSKLRYYAGSERLPKG